MQSQKINKKLIGLSDIQKDTISEWGGNPKLMSDVEKFYELSRQTRKKWRDIILKKEGLI